MLMTCWTKWQSKEEKKNYSLIPTEVCVIPICRRIKINLRTNTVFWDQLPVLYIRSRSPTAFLPAASRLQSTTRSITKTYDIRYKLSLGCVGGLRLVKKLHLSRERCATRGRLLLWSPAIGIQGSIYRCVMLPNVALRKFKANTAAQKKHRALCRKTYWKANDINWCKCVELSWQILPTFTVTGLYDDRITLHTTNSPPLSFVANSRRVAARQSPPPPWHPSPMMQGQPARLTPRSFEIGTPPVPQAHLDIGKLKYLKSGVAQGASNGPCTPHNKTESKITWFGRIESQPREYQKQEMSCKLKQGCNLLSSY